MSEARAAARLLAILIAANGCAKHDPSEAKIRADDASSRARPAPSLDLPDPEPADAPDETILVIELDAHDNVFMDGKLVSGESAIASEVAAALASGRKEGHIYASPKTSATLVMKVLEILTRKGMQKLTIRSSAKGPVSITIGGSSP